MNREKRMVSMVSGNGSPMISQKQDRNAKCYCKSGKKAKNCCGCETKYYHSKVKTVDQVDKSTEETTQP